MNSKDSRQNSRRQLERRLSERRRIPYQFGSIEWLNAIRREYILWPKQDRRERERRSEDRRIGSRRTSNLGFITTSSMQQKRLHNLLTAEEKQMLNQLIKNDDSDD